MDVKGPADEYPSQYVDVEHLMEGLAKVPARHVLVVLDASYAGITLPPRFEMQMRGDPATGRLDQDLRSRVSRRVLTSARSDQVAADGGTRFPRNSLFTGWLLEGLERASEGREDVETPDGNRDGVITGLELYAFLESRVSRESDSRQTPAYGPFELDQRGDFMLRSRTDPTPPGG